MNDLLHRIIIALAIGIVLLPSLIIEKLGIAWFAFIALTSILSLVELIKIMEKKYIKPFKFSLSLSTAILLALFFLKIKIQIHLFFIFLFALYIALVLTHSNFKREEWLITWFFNVFSVVYIGLFLGSNIYLKVMSERVGWLLAGIPLVVAWLTDTGGYFLGKLLPIKKLETSSSPNKTVGGILGSMLGAIVSFIFLNLLISLAHIDLSSVPRNLLIVENKISGLGVILISLAGYIGDFVESGLKRWAEIKDTSNLFGPHGGILDIFDSVIFASFMTYLILFVNF